jgi:hypothetical protein
MIITVLVLFASTFASGQTASEPKKADFCGVVASPSHYYGKLLSVQVILAPSEHALYLYGTACVPKQGYDVTTKAILPPTLESLPNGKRLIAILRRQRAAKAEVVGTFENNAEPFGLDPSRFRFTIAEIASVKEVGPERRPIGER